MVVPFTTVKPVMATPLSVTAVAPVKLVPVTVTVVPLLPEVGVKLVMVGEGVAGTIVSVPGAVAVPPSVGTTTVPEVAPEGITNVIVVELTTV